MTPVPVTLATGAACVLLNIWLGWRISSLRFKLKVTVGDGGQEPLLRRMRAQANFIENAPFVLILLGGLELSGASRLGLALVAGIFILARIAHGIGMDGGSVGVWRRNGILTSIFVSLAFAFWAIARVAAPYLGR
jgi:uncharacterized membrane protein YecN with MAPEG domain